MEQTFLIKKIEDERSYQTRHGDNRVFQNVILQWTDKVPNREGVITDVNQFIRAKMFNNDVQTFRSAGLKAGDWMNCHLRFDIQGKYDNNEITIVAPKRYQ